MNNENVSIRRGDQRFIERYLQEQNPRITEPLKNPNEHVDPIIEYAQEPLLPLVQACIPLMDIIPNLSKYIEIVLRETPSEPSDGLTYDESASIRLYTIEWEENHSSLYLKLNMTLKKPDRLVLRPYYKYLKLLLTALIKLPSAPLQTIWRGVNKNLSAEFPRGTPVTWWAFSSCTTSLTVLENNMYLGDSGERTLFSVEAMNGRIIRAHSHFDYEDEVILLPGTYMEVQSQLSPAPDLHIIHLKQIKPQETLLALPFEDALLYSREIKIIPWYKKKRTIVELSILISLCFAGIIIGIVFGTKKIAPPPICRPRSLGITADLLWSFDCEDAREDLKGVYNGTAQNDVKYSSPDFSNRGKALNFNRKINQYIQLPQSLNLSSNTSFTVTLWKFSTNYNRATILIDCNPLNSICIELYILSVNIYAKVYSWYNQGSSYWVIYEAWKVNYQSCWIHLAFTFDLKISQLTIYFNGYPMKFNYFYPSYFPRIEANESLPTLIGSNSIKKDPYPFDGLIDQLTVSYYRKNHSEILREATLLCSYDFETDDINYDNGPNNIPAYSENVYHSQERTLIFNSSDSFFQTSGFTLMMSNFYAFSISFWIRPIFLSSDKENSAVALFQLASKVQQVTSETHVCFLTIQIVNSTRNNPTLRILYGQLNMFMSLDKYQIRNNTWTHIFLTYFDKAQMYICINGKNCRNTNDDRFSLLLSAPRFAVTIGGNYFDDMITNKPTNYESRACFAERPEFNFTQLYGQIDELKFFSRRLTTNEIKELTSTKNVNDSSV